MTERDYAIRSFKEITLNAARHTEERMDLYYEKMKALMNNYQDLILENQMVLDELEHGLCSSVYGFLRLPHEFRKTEKRSKQYHSNLWTL